MKKSVFLLLGIVGILLSATACKKEKEITAAEAVSETPAKIVVIDTTYKRFMLDTTLRFSDSNKLLEYRIKLDTGFFNYKEKILSKPHSEDTAYKLDSVGYLNQDFCAYLLFKLLKNSPKTKENLYLISFNLDFSKLITLQQRLDLFNEFPQDVRDSQQGKKMLAKLTQFTASVESTNVGRSIEPSTKISLKKVNGSTITLGNLLDSKHKKFLIIFGASWCGPCRHENQYLKRVLSKIDTTEVKIIGISVDTDQAKWLKMVEKDECPWIQVKDSGGMEGALAKAMNAKSLPANILVDSNKVILDEQVNLELILPKIIRK